MRLFQGCFCISLHLFLFFNFLPQKPKLKLLICFPKVCILQNSCSEIKVFRKIPSKKRCSSFFSELQAEHYRLVVTGTGNQLLRVVALTLDAPIVTTLTVRHKNHASLLLNRCNHIVIKRQDNEEAGHQRRIQFCCNIEDGALCDNS